MKTTGSCNAELMFRDDTINKSKKRIQTNCELIQNLLDSYNKILDNLISYGFQEGEVHDALKEFKTYSLELKDVVKSVGTESAGLLNNLMIDVDRADKWLY